MGMGLLVIFIILLCIATSFFSVGAVTGVKLGSNYTSAVSLKTAIVFTVIALLAMAVSFILGRMLYSVLIDVYDWVGFALLLLIAIHFLLESMEKTPSLNYTDVENNNYMIKVAVQVSLDLFLLAFVVALTNHKAFLFTLLFGGLFAFCSVLFGLSHGYHTKGSVIANRLELVAGIVMTFIAIRFLLVALG
jgi:Predicted membrane protein